MKMLKSVPARMARTLVVALTLAAAAAAGDRLTRTATPPPPFAEAGVPTQPLAVQTLLHLLNEP